MLFFAPAMKILASSVLSVVAMIAVLPDTLMGNPRAQTIQVTCGSQLQHNTTFFGSNYVANMQNISDQIMIQGWGVSSVGSGPDTNYALAQCHDDLSVLECVSCYARVRTGLDQCYPFNGGRIFLDGCFLRVENYSFFQEYTGSWDHAVCGIRTRKDSAFQESARRAVVQAAMEASNSNGFARAEMPVSGASNESAYVLANCWKTLNANSCRTCLENASSSILGCLPWSEGRALNTGCFMRYSNTNFFNPAPQNSTSNVALAGNTSTALLGLKCGNERGQNNPAFVPNYMSTLQDMALQLNQSGFAVGVTSSGPNSPNDAFSLAQCYSNVSSSDCLLCYAEARTMLPVCYLRTTEIFLSGCFFRADYYNFFHEYLRPEDKVVCANGTRKNIEFRQAAAKGLSDAIKNNGYTLIQLPASGTPMETAYVLANCWKSLSSESCSACLKNASASLSSCLPSTEGFALNTGCIVRYADSDFLNTNLGNRSSRGEKSGSSRGKKLIIVVAVVCLVVSVAGAVVVGGYMRKHKELQKKRKASNLAGANDKKFAMDLRDGGLECKYSTLKKATGSFHDSNRLGQGGFGTVYKGVLPDGREIAVKRLFFNNHHRAADFYNEVNIISSIRHKNLVKLLGCSCSGPESLLVYELLPNGSLDRLIFDPCKGTEVLNWEKRFNIIMGTAEGLVYLHENTETRIVHRDIKASNILLDSKLNAKIADFGLARSFEEDKSHISTAIAGTLGYMAPEYISHGQLTEKADVYSFGVLLLEIVTGRQNNKNKTSEYSDSLVTAIWKHFQKERAQELFDKNLMLNGNRELSIEHEMLRVVHVGLLCTQKMPSLRPSMSTALQMLSRRDEHLPSPTPPPYVDGDELTTGLGDIQNEPSYTLKSGDSVSNASLPYSTFYGR